MPPKKKSTDELIGERIRSARHVRKMTLDDLGKAVGVRFNVIHKIEMGSVKMTVDRLMKIAAALHQPVTWFLPK